MRMCACTRAYVQARARVRMRVWMDACVHENQREIVLGTACSRAGLSYLNDFAMSLVAQGKHVNQAHPPPLLRRHIPYPLARTVSYTCTHASA